VIIKKMYIPSQKSKQQDNKRCIDCLTCKWTV